MGALFGAGLAAGCSSTQITDTWTDPSAQGKPMSKVAVLAMTPDEGIRRMAEDEAAKAVKNAQVVPSYQALAGVDLSDKAAVQAKLAEQGFQGLLVMRLAGVEEQVSAAPLDAYYDDAYGMAYGPYAEVDTVVRMVSNLYSVDQGKLIWSGASETFDPASVRQMVDDVARAVAKTLEKNGILA
jgi:hypothetical protein